MSQKLRDLYYVPWTYQLLPKEALMDVLCRLVRGQGHRCDVTRRLEE